MVLGGFCCYCDLAQDLWCGCCQCQSRATCLAAKYPTAVAAVVAVDDASLHQSGADPWGLLSVESVRTVAFLHLEIKHFKYSF